jgi:GT2 family glycosyltransferase
VVPTKDRPERAGQAVRQALGQTRLPERVVLVDASAAPPPLPGEVVADAGQLGVELVVLRAAPSTAGQRNRGIEAVDSPLVLLLDDDVVIPPDYSERLVERWERAGLEAYGAVVGSTSPVKPGRTATWMRRLLMLHVDDPGGSGTRLRRSGKVIYVEKPPVETTIPVVGAGAVVYRTDLALKHPFDERFEGYALGEDLEMASRVSREAPILQLPDPEYLHEREAGGRSSPERWRYRGQRETYFRLRRLDRSPLTLAAFGLSLLGELLAAAAESVRERSLRPVRGYAGGALESVREAGRSLPAPAPRSRRTARKPAGRGPGEAG